MDDAEIANTIFNLALPQLDLNQIVRKGFSASDAEALGKKLGIFYYGFYQGVLAGLAEARQESIPEVDEAKLDDTLYTKTRKGGPIKTGARVIPQLRQSKLNDVVLSKGKEPRK